MERLKPIILPYLGIYPKIAPDAFIAPGACIIGDVEIGSGSGIWFNCVIRGDVAPIKIGHNTNIQDGTVIHVTRKTGPTNIGSGVTVGHKCLLHACTIQDSAFIGMGATVIDRTIVETNAMVAAGSMVTQGKVIKTGEIWAGNPAKFLRLLRQDEIDYFKVSEKNYSKHAEEYIEILKNYT
ncbi:Gamma carbonic anhydrase-like protein [Rickettsiales bacterium Ac37b]|nr:Gamma carbonic anhydrase-like protein [Rickettsiales bacterium Ac37b]